VIENRIPLMDDPIFRRFFGQGVPREQVQRSLGSGVIVDPSGLIMTNNHVIEGATEVKVSLADKREFEADIVLKDSRTDLAVLRIKDGRETFPALEFGNSDDLQVGDMVLAIGNPFGVGQTVTQGIVSAVARTQVGVSDFQSFIQTDAAINPGNSGGALVDMAGRLVGINTAIFSRSGGSMGIGFAIPSAMVRVVVESARTGSANVRRPWFGARLQGVTADVAESLGLDRPTGILVTGIIERGPAAEAGLRRGDIITGVDGVSVDDPDAFGYRFATRPLGGTVPVQILRGGQRQTLNVRAAPAPETRPRDAVTLRTRSPFAGAVALNLSPAVAEELSLDATQEGVVLSDVEPGSAAAQLGFRKGDIVVAINGERIETTRELERILATRPRYWEITINRGGQVLTTAVAG
jgi:Do/DeqQ family serine protease